MLKSMNSIIHPIMRSPSLFSELLHLYDSIVTPSVKKQQRNRRDNMIMNRWTTTFPLLLAFLVRQTCAQQVGVDICACQPTAYEITLDFQLVCNDANVQGPGINETACVISSRLPDSVNLTDLVPVQVDDVQILELDQNQNIVGQTVYTDGPYLNGNKIYYTSILRSDPNLVNSVSLPSGIQVSINGNNALNQPLFNSWGILYDNDCGVFPLVEIGEKIGWSVFTDLGDPPLELCPSVLSTMFPTRPLINETATPNINATLFPTVSPPIPAPPATLPPLPNRPLVSLPNNLNEPSSKAGTGYSKSKSKSSKMHSSKSGRRKSKMSQRS